jgi:GMP synthase PP-ATPase subunit
MFNAKEFIKNSLKEIADSVGDSRVISACSGGVDSTVATYLVHKAVRIISLHFSSMMA